jgi:hypothetical protein
MANTITFEMSDSHLKSFERLLDDFNSRMARAEANQPTRDERYDKA